MYHIKKVYPYSLFLPIPPSPLLPPAKQPLRRRGRSSPIPLVLQRSSPFEEGEEAAPSPSGIGEKGDRGGRRRAALLEAAPSPSSSESL